MVEDWDKAVAKFDRRSFGVFCRKLEVLVVRKEVARARRLFEQYLAAKPEEKLGLDCHVSQALDVRAANALEDAGYDSMRSCFNATEQELSKVPGLGPVAIETVKQIAAELESGVYRPVDGDQDLEPDWNLEVYMSGGSAIDVLLNAGPELVSEIDAEIEKLKARLAQLRRVRKMVSPGGSSGVKRSSSASDERDVQTLLAIVKKRPMEVKKLAPEAGIHPIRIHAIIKKTGKLKINDEGLVTLA